MKSASHHPRVLEFKRMILSGDEQGACRILRELEQETIATSRRMLFFSIFMGVVTLIWIFVVIPWIPAGPI